MSHRLSTRIGLPAPEDSARGVHDVIRFREPTAGSEVRTKGSLFLLAQLTGDDAAQGRAAGEALEALERDYYYDLSSGALGALSKALAGANRRIYHQRSRLGIPRHGGISIIGLVVRGSEGHVAKLGAASAVICRGGRMFELPPPAAEREEDPRIRERRVAATLGEALEVEPHTWQGELVAEDRIALISRNLAQLTGTDDLQQALTGLRPAAAVEHLQQVFRIRGGIGSNGVLVVEMAALGATETLRPLEPVRPAEPLAGLPDQSPVPLADAIGRAAHRSADGIDALQAAFGRGILYGLNLLLAFAPRRRPRYPSTILQTEVQQDGRRRRRGLLGMAVAAAFLAAGATVASLPNARPTDAIPRAAVARAAIIDAQDSLALVSGRIDGRDLVDRDPERATASLNTAFAAIADAMGAGVPAAALSSLQDQVDRGLDRVYAVGRIRESITVVDLAASFSPFEPLDMVVATDGSLWVAELGRGRLIRIDAATGEATVMLRSGQVVDGQTAGAPWLLATAATDVVLIDRQRRAWRFDLALPEPRLLALPGLDAVSSPSHLMAALQHRPPLEIFNLYLVDAVSGQVDKWSPGNVVPVVFPGAQQQFLTGTPDVPAASATDLLVDANLWLLHARTVTRVNFGLPLPQSDFSLDPPPDAEVRPRLDYQLLEGATVGERDLFYVYDAANARIIAYQRADGVFVRQWLAPRSGPDADLLDRVLAMSVASVSDGPPAAYLLTPERIVRVVLE